ncbi:MAG TPA: ATPase, partial [Chromatiaceae bacterium]|nr:ATPase [Chromatiaceae bacterium]
MYWLVALMSFAILALILGGLILEARPTLTRRIRPWYRPAMGTQLLAFVGAQLGLLVLGINDAFAQAADTVTVVNEISTGMGLAIIGADGGQGGGDA